MRTDEALRRSASRIGASIQELKSLSRSEAAEAETDPNSIAAAARRLAALLFEHAALSPGGSGLTTFRHAASAALLERDSLLRLCERLPAESVEAVAQIMTETATGCRAIWESQPGPALQLGTSESAGLLVPSLAEHLFLAAERAAALQLTSTAHEPAAAVAGEVLAVLDSLHLAIGDAAGLTVSTAARLAARQGGHLQRGLLPEVAQLLDSRALLMLGEAGLTRPSAAPGELSPSPAPGTAGAPVVSPSEIDSYGPIAEISSSGPGSVYSGIHPLLGLPVAIHAYSRDSVDSAARERLAATAARIVALDHPGIVRLYHAGTEAEPILVVTELVEGRTLRSVLTDTGPLPEGVGVDLFAQLLAAVGAAHAAGLVHGGISSGSVLVSAGGQLKIAGLGLGGLAFAHPGDDPGADVRALGEILLEMLAGGRTAGAEPVQPAVIRSSLQEVIDLAAGTRTSFRPVTVADLALALSASTEPSADRPPPPPSLRVLSGPTGREPEAGGELILAAVSNHIASEVTEVVRARFASDPRITILSDSAPHWDPEGQRWERSWVALRDQACATRVDLRVDGTTGLFTVVVDGNVAYAVPSGVTGWRAGPLDDPTELAAMAARMLGALTAVVGGRPSTDVKATSELTHQQIRKISDGADPT